MGAFENNSGKLGAKIFKEDLLNNCGSSRPEVIQGPSFGVDTSVIDLGHGLALAVSSDPLSLIPSLGMEISAWLSVHLLANDMCTTGFPPQYAQFVLNLPTDLSREDFNAYWKHIDRLCKTHDIAITGGHTGQIQGQESTISGGGTMFLTAPKEEILTSNGARVGDSIIMTKSAALSSTSLLALAFPETVKEKLGEQIQRMASENFWKISVLEESRIAVGSLQANVDLHAMHDVTEGGVLGALDEMAEASGLGFEINADLIPVKDEAQKIADLFEIDPLFSVGAGSMIMAVSAQAENQLLASFESAGIPAKAIGSFIPPSKKLIARNGTTKEFFFDGNDPYWAAFFKALTSEWT